MPIRANAREAGWNPRRTPETDRPTTPTVATVDRQPVRRSVRSRARTASGPVAGTGAKPAEFRSSAWWRGRDLNRRPSGNESSDRCPGLSLLVPDCAPELGFLALLVPLRPDSYWVRPRRTVEDPVDDPPLEGPSLRRCTPPSGPARSNCRLGIAPPGRTWGGSGPPPGSTSPDRRRPARYGPPGRRCRVSSRRAPAGAHFVMGTGSSGRGARIDRTDPGGAPGVGADSRQNPSPGGRLEDPPQPGTWVPGMPGHVNDK